jgi:uncharacterized protein YpiB (UPF0302 family)
MFVLWFIYFSELLRIYSQSYYRKNKTEDYKYSLIFLKKTHIILKSIEVILMNEKSYTELMKIGAMKRQGKENFVQDLYIDMLLSEIQLNVEKEKLLKKIDCAIDHRDKQKFYLLSKKLVEINKRLGT